MRSKTRENIIFFLKMLKRIYIIFDSTGTPLRRFNTFVQAETFRISRGRPDWQIKEQVISQKSEIWRR